jgi:hypothetical protein
LNQANSSSPIRASVEPGVAVAVGGIGTCIWGGGAGTGLSVVDTEPAGGAAGVKTAGLNTAGLNE